MTCKNCEKRYLGCHSNCEEYKSFVKAREEIRRARDSEHLMSDVTYQGYMRIKKARFKKG